MEINLHVSVQESASSGFEQEMKQKFATIPADSVTSYPEDIEGPSTLEEQAEVDFWYVVATKRMAPSDIQARIARLQNFLIKQQQCGNVLSIEFEPDDQEAMRLLVHGLARGHTYRKTPLSVFFLTTAIESTPSFHVIDGATGRFDMGHALLLGEHVPLPVNTLWCKVLYGHYVTLSFRQDRRKALADPQSCGEMELLKAELFAWNTWFSGRATDDPILAQHEQHLSQLASAMEQNAATVQGVLAQFPTMHHFKFHQTEGFTCQRCALKTHSPRLAYYHGFLTS